MIRQVGAILSGSHCVFTVWAPQKEKMVLHIVEPSQQKIEMQKDDFGYFTAELDNVTAGTRYFYMPDGTENVPDPASFYQPEGVHGPSEVVDHNTHQWCDQQWHGITLEYLIFYELHVGTFTPEGTFEAIIPRLDDIVATGITAIELMPIGQFPGGRNWGYDGVYPYAAQNTYGGPEGLKKLVDACHAKGLSVFLDVVYNHIGPEGNYLGKYGPYFSSKYRIPWGDAVNFDGEWSDGVRNYFCNNAIYWLKNYHLDGLRVDAIHQMYDFGAVHFWELMHATVKEAEQKVGKHFYLIAESDLNNPKVVKHPCVGGYGFDGQWLDDFHHALYVMLYPKGKRRYCDFGKIEQVAKAYTDGFVHSGEYVSFRKKKYGAPSTGIPGYRFVAFIQNHDQIGNTADGARLCTQISHQMMKVGMAALLLAPYLPMLFMGEEYIDNAPFLYFVSHSDKELIEAVKNGRKKEFEGEQWDIAPSDPQDEETFNRCKLTWEKRNSGNHKEMLEWNKALIDLRKKHLALRNFDKNTVRVYIINPQCYVLHRRSDDEQHHILALFNLSGSAASFILPGFAKSWHLVLASGTLPAGSTTIQPLKEIAMQPQSVIVLSNNEPK